MVWQHYSTAFLFFIIFFCTHSIFIEFLIHSLMLSALACFALLLEDCEVVLAQCGGEGVSIILFTTMYMSGN